MSKLSTRNEIDLHNARYHELTPQQLDKWSELMVTKTSSWPFGLQRCVEIHSKKYGLCSEIVAAVVAEWVRSAGNAQDWMDNSCGMERDIARSRGEADPALWGDDETGYFKEESGPHA